MAEKTVFSMVAGLVALMAEKKAEQKDELKE
jgi:hypothetical protein